MRSTKILDGKRRAGIIYIVVGCRGRCQEKKRTKIKQKKKQGDHGKFE